MGPTDLKNLAVTSLLRMKAHKCRTGWHHWISSALIKVNNISISRPIRLLALFLQLFGAFQL